MDGNSLAQFIPLILIFVILFLFNKTTAKKELKSTKIWCHRLREVTK